jgi:hypothetical protein
MPDVKHALRATSDALLRDLDALAALEEEKRSLPLDDPRLQDLAGQIEQIAARVLAGSRRQTALSATAAQGQSTTPIEEVRRPVAAILEEWRALERRAAAAEPGSAEADEIEILAARLREEYRRTVAKVDSGG